MRISFRISLLNHGLSLFRIVIIFVGIHSCAIFRKHFVNFSHISSTSNPFVLIAFFSADRMKATKKQKLSKEAIDLVKQFGNALKPALKKAIKTKGLEHAVEFCAVKAPEITKKINQQNKEWTIKRVSLKNRNPSAKPDNWERKVLKMFDKRQSNGESAKKMAYSEMVNGEFRFMKAQGVQGVCLSCHSKNIAKNIKSAIDKHYPNDKAIGYSLGQIRGAFSLSKKL